MAHENPCGGSYVYENPPDDEFADIYAQAAVEGGNGGDDVPWQAIIGGGASIINTAIKGAFGGYGTPTSTAPSGDGGVGTAYDPYAKKSPGVPTWVWIAGAAGVGLIVWSQGRKR